MIRVLIAEDEPPTLRRLKRMIEQTDPDFTVVATAPDGEKAMELLEEIPCDVVFTDIRMPVMDGLAVMDAVHARFPECLVVAVSGYQDFAYVSHAVRAQILDYILKPVSPEAMEELLARIKEKHEQRSRERLSRQLSAQVNRSVVPPRGETPQDAAMALCVCLFSAGTLPPSDDGEMYPGAEVWETLSPEQALDALDETGVTGFTWSFMGNTPVERILIFETGGGDCSETVREIHAWLAARAQAPINCACAPGEITLPETGATIRRLRRQLKTFARIGHGDFFLLEMDSPEPPSGDVEQETVAKLSSLIRRGLMQRGTPFWRELLLRMEREAWPQAKVYRLFMRALDQLEGDPKVAPKARPYRAVVSEVLSTALSMDDVVDSLAEMTALDEENTPGGVKEGIAFRIERYLRAHYREHINNQTLAQAFGYVPSYVSLLFRQAYGQSPAEYLTHIRLEEAKRLMEASPHLLIREVAEQVGFKSQHHFSRIFKKNEGMWPSSYQS